MGFGRPLHSRKDPRHVSGGRSPYVYRREAGVEMGFGGHHRFPTLYVSKKIKDKEQLELLTVQKVNETFKGIEAAVPVLTAEGLSLRLFTQQARD